MGDVYTYGPHRMPRMTYRGREQTYVMKLALTQVGETMYELIESVEGPNIYEEFLATRGEGLHHLGYGVPDIEAEIQRMAGDRDCAAPEWTWFRAGWRRRVCLLRHGTDARLHH